MSEKNNNNIVSNEDTLDINELASLDGEVSNELIEQLQSKISVDAANFSTDESTSPSEDASLFEEVKQEEPQKDKQSPKINLDENFDDNFIKKYKAKLNKQKSSDVSKETNPETKIENKQDEIQNTSNIEPNIKIETPINNLNIDINSDIEKLSGGNIIEKPIVREQVEYNDSLDFLDNNIKYSKYVIYIDPENTEFIESLTVKERKNLINKILREQDDIAITKRRLNLFQTVIKHSIIAIVTVAISIPIIYWTINASLEATIDNHRRSQTIFKTLYREKGKIKTKTSVY